MLRNRLYYALKPFVPWSIRIGIRRCFVARKRCQVSDVWPILPGSERPPEGWLGWPDGKRFAFVLTHDVEGPDGLAKVKPLAELEMGLGFRSSFNFIPEGPYIVPAALRTWLVENGFEVGVHDLRHNGKLYSSRRSFSQCASRINTYLRDWNAVGFRSGFMLRELDWLHDLEIAYDASTFDTDPFEPQPDHAGTIFPFWVSHDVREDQRPQLEDRSPNTGDCVQSGAAALPTPISDLRSPTPTAPRLGYVELPYTLPQDSTLFLLLREKSPEIWIRKLDWIARHGGMALLDTHPDYIAFGEDKVGCATYDLETYRSFLEYARTRHAGTFWHALPRAVAKHVHSTTRPVTLPNTPKPTLHLRSSDQKPKIWIDLDNTPHVPFFEPIIEELRKRGYPVLVTARDAFQVCDLADKKAVQYVKVGRHYGKNPLAKLSGLAYRALQLAPIVFKERPAIGVSHGARSQLILATWLRLPTLLLEDYEYCQFPPMMRPTCLMTPSVIPDALLLRKNRRLYKYPGIKEDVYAWKLQPGDGFLRNLGIEPGCLVATVRPPATEAHYHNPESELLFAAFMDRACATPETRIILLPRNRKQADWIREKWPTWFRDGNTIIPKTALDGMELIWNSDLVVSGGGTMNREAAALGIPVYSIFRGTIGAVDRHLESEGRLVLVTSLADVNTKIKLERRVRKPLSEVTSRRTLDHFVNTIEELALAKRR